MASVQRQTARETIKKRVRTRFSNRHPAKSTPTFVVKAPIETCRGGNTKRGRSPSHFAGMASVENTDTQDFWGEINSSFGQDTQSPTHDFLTPPDVRHTAQQDMHNMTNVSNDTSAKRCIQNEVRTLESQLHNVLHSLRMSPGNNSSTHFAHSHRPSVYFQMPNSY